MALNKDHHDATEGSGGRNEFDGIRDGGGSAGVDVVNGRPGESQKPSGELPKERSRGKGIEERLRKELAELRDAHTRELSEAEDRYQQMVEEKDTQYKNLIDRVSLLKERMGDKLKADADALADTQHRVAELEEENQRLNNSLDELRTEYRKLNEESTDAVREAANLRNRLNLSQQNWNKEREELVVSEQYVRGEYETAQQAMQDWEVFAREERSMRESISDRVVELEEQITTLKEAYEKAVEDRDSQSSTVNDLRRALADIQQARKQELREMTENTKITVDELTAQSQTMEKRAVEAEAELKETKERLERFQQYEKEVKEKTLLIGKLRHEAVTLNDHLTKALRMLKKGNASDNIDKQLVTNVFLSFLSIQRGDAKKYEVLQLIASVLDWNDEQRERAGLVRPGASASGSTLNAPATSYSRATSPMSPYFRTPSTPTMSDPYDGMRELWSSVLDSPQVQQKPY